MDLADVQITIRGETVHVEGMTDAGVEFIDSYLPNGEGDIIVIDSGIIEILPSSLDHLHETAKTSEITCETADA